MEDVQEPIETKGSQPERSPQPTPDISVVIVSWNVAGLLADCLDSLTRCTDGLTLEVWVVDNASSDNTVEMLRTRYPGVRLIANEDNRGFARANNQAIRQARGRFVLILNPDTVVQHGAIRSLFQFLVEHNDVGMAGPRHVNGSGNIGVAAARRFLTLNTVLWIEALGIHALPRIGPCLFRRLVNPYDFAVTQEVECISGAAMLVRREVLQDLQGFGETFRHYGEDLDLCFRMRAAGWKIYYHAAATIVHLVGQSSKQAPIRCTINEVLSEEEYFVRCYGRIHGCLYRLIIQGILAPKIVAMGCLKRLVGVESAHQWEQRLRMVGCLMKWRPVE